MLDPDGPDVNFAELVQQARYYPSAEESSALKAALDLVSVCEELGIMLEEDENGKFHGLCPFHPDHRPSFDVFYLEDGSQACGCFACDFGTPHDVYDLLVHLRDSPNYKFDHAYVEARALLSKTKHYTPRARPVERQAADFALFTTNANARAGDDATAISGMLVARVFDAPAAFAVSEFTYGISPDGAGVVIPHFDLDGNVTGAKIRRASSHDRPWCPVALPKSKLSALYGAWRLTGANGRKAKSKIVVCEGESDVLCLAWWSRDRDYDVVGLPHGTSGAPKREWLDFLAGKEVTIFFDADLAGYGAMRRWAEALKTCRIARLPHGLDVAAAGAKAALEAVASAPLYRSEPTDGLVPVPGSDGGLARAGDDKRREICNAAMSVRAVVEIEDSSDADDEKTPAGRMFEVDLVRSPGVQRVYSRDFMSDTAFRKWANARAAYFSGGTRDTQEMLRVLNRESAFVPMARGTSVIGLHDGAFVFPPPLGAIGATGRIYIRPHARAKFEVYLPQGHWPPSLLSAVLALHRPAVMTPLLGWLAAAPLRSLFKNFPVFALVGGAGRGKSTLVEYALMAFGYRDRLVLSGTTPHGLATFMNNTNSIPVWVDEIRRGGREDSRLRFEQTIRDAWDNASSFKGGLKDQKQDLTEFVARAPLIVSGEDSFTETSHLERMAIVHLPRDGRENLDKFDGLKADYGDLKSCGFGRAYLEFLVDRLQKDWLPEQPVVPNRPAHARSVVAWGYSVLEQFAHDVLGFDLPAYDGTLIAQTHAETVPPLIEALRACEGRMSPSAGGLVVWRDGTDVCVRLHDFYAESQRLEFRLPNRPAVQKELSETYGAVEEKDWNGRFLRLRDAHAVLDL